MRVINLEEYRKAKKIQDIPEKQNSIQPEKEISLHEQTLSQIEKAMSKPLWNVEPPEEKK